MNGLWGGGCEKSYIDVKVFNPYPLTNYSSALKFIGIIFFFVFCTHLFAVQLLIHHISVSKVRIDAIFSLITFPLSGNLNYIDMWCCLFFIAC